MANPKPISPRLWTPVANSLEAYRRRFILEPCFYYEHIWRLFHINESLIVTLASALATRILYVYGEQLDDTVQAYILNVCRTLTGLDENDRNKEAKTGCLSGSIYEWINLLGNAENFDRAIGSKDPFIHKVSSYLNENIPEKLAFFEDWERIAPVAQTQKSEELSRIKRLRAINELRNKLAHAPISSRILRGLHTGLRKEIVRLLTPEEEKWDGKEDLSIQKYHSPLCGTIIYKSAYVTGSNFGKIEDHDNSDKNHSNSNDDVFIEWLDGSSTQSWKASPFFYFDEEFKVSLLFRINNLSYDLDNIKGEYYRFAAEVEPIQRRDLKKEIIEKILPIPKKLNEDDTNNEINEANDSQIEAPKDESQCLKLRDEAETAFNRGEFQRAVECYEVLSHQCRQNYNDVAQSRHGASLWRVANRSEEDLTIKKEKFQRAIQLLEESSKHIDINYKAQAFYQQSKAYWHLAEAEAKIDRKSYYDNLEKAIDSIGKSLELVVNETYLSWYDWLDEKQPDENDESKEEPIHDNSRQE